MLTCQELNVYYSHLLFCYIRGLVPKAFVKLERFLNLCLFPKMDFTYSTLIQSVLQFAPYSTNSHSQQ